MRYTRLWTDHAGESHLEDLVPAYQETENYAAGVPTVGTTERLEAGVTHLVRFPAGWVGDWHPTPARQFWALLHGRMGAEVSDGVEIASGPGDCGVLEDTTGRGHKSWVIGNEDAVVVMVTLPE